MATNREIRLSRTVDTREAAERLEAELLERRDDGGLDAERTTLGQLLDLWTARGAERWTEHYARDVAGMIRLHLATLLPLRLVDLSAMRIEQHFVAMAKSGVGQARRRQLYSILAAACEDAVRYGYLDRNPVKLVRRPPAPRRDVEPPSPEDVATLLEASTPDFALFIGLSVVLGTRRGETLALRYRSFESGSVVVRATITDKLVEKPYPKGGRARRVAVHPVTLDAIVRYAPSGSKPEHYVFSDDGLVPWHPGKVSRRFRTTCDECGLPHLRLHDLRHASVTWQLNAGIPINAVARRVGHSSPFQTLNTYGHALPVSDVAAAELLAGLLPFDELSEEVVRHI
jgi:integrase